MGGSASGRRIMKVDPLPGCDHTRTSPPWFCTVCLTMLSPSPDAAGVARAGRVDAVEPLEHALEFVGLDADALVGDGDLDGAVDDLRADADPATLARVRDRVRDQVVHGDASRARSP